MAFNTLTFTIFTAVFLAAVCVVAGDTCLAYTDSDGVWHGSFECESIFDGGSYCCGTFTDKYCCINEDDRINEGEQLSATIIGVIISVAVLVIIIGAIVCICVCCCNACRSRSTTTTYVQGAVSATPTVVMSSSQQSSVIPGNTYAPTVANNPMYPTAGYNQMNPGTGFPPPYASEQKY